MSRTRTIDRLVIGAVVAFGLSATVSAAISDRVYVFLRSNKIYLRIPQGPEYPATVDSPVYEDFAQRHAGQCATEPVVSVSTPPYQYYRPRKGGETGEVRVELLVDPVGRVAAIQVRENSAGPLSLYSVLRAAQDWTFEPGRTDDGQAAYCRYEYGVRYVPPP